MQQLHHMHATVENNTPVPSQARPEARLLPSIKMRMYNKGRASLHGGYNV